MLIDYTPQKTMDMIDYRNYKITYIVKDVPAAYMREQSLSGAF